MAFVDFRPENESATGAHGPAFATWATAQTPTTIDDISELEWRVVELAEADALTTLQPTRKRGWFGRFLFGPQAPSRELANERLEALRRLAVHAWHDGYRLPASAIKDAVRAGYSEMQAGRVIDGIVERRLARRGAVL